MRLQELREWLKKAGAFDSRVLMVKEAQELIADIACELKAVPRADGFDYKKAVLTGWNGALDAIGKQLDGMAPTTPPKEPDQRTTAQTGHPHGVFETGGERVLYVDERRIRTRDDANRLRGHNADRIQVFGDTTLPKELADYLHNEVLAPLQWDIRQRKEAAQSPAILPADTSAAWGLMVVKRLEALERQASTLAERVDELHNSNARRLAALEEKLVSLPQQQADYAIAKYAAWDKRLAWLEEKTKYLNTQENLTQEVLNEHEAKLKALKALEAFTPERGVAAGSQLGIELSKIRDRLNALEKDVTAVCRSFEAMMSRVSRLEGHVIPHLAGQAAADPGLHPMLTTKLNKQVEMQQKMQEQAQQSPHAWIAKADERLSGGSLDRDD